MSDLLNWADKKNSANIEEFIAKYGEEYCLTAEEINEMRDAINEMAVIQQSVCLGPAEPTDTPAGTGANYWEVIVPGTYTNFGGMVLPANNRGLIYRNAAGAFSISFSGLDLSGKVNVSDIIDEINSTESDKPASANSVRLVSEKISDIKNSLSEFEVVTGVNESVDGYYYDNDGNFTPAGGYKATKFDVTGLTDDLFVTTTVNTAPIFTVAKFYNSSDIFISEQHPWSSGSAFTVVREKLVIPAGTKYIRINNYYSPNAPAFGVLEKAILSSVKQSDLVPIINDIDNLNSDIIGINLEITDIKNSALGFEVITGVNESFDGYYYNVYGAFQPVGGYKSTKYDITGITADLFATTKVNTGTNLSMVHYYDSSDTYISSQNSWSSGGVAVWIREKCIIPDGTKYIGISNYYSPNAAEFGVLEKNIFSAASKEEVNALTSYWSGKKLVTIGDSITYANFWQPELIRTKGLVFSIVENQSGTGGHKPMGLGSSRIIPLINNAYIGQQSGNSIYERADDVDYYSPDLITLFGGQNDINKAGTVLGTISDAAYTGGAVSSSPPTFISAYKGTLEKLILQNPTAKIICITPMWASDSFYDDKKPFCDAIIEIAKMYSCLSINLLEESGANIINHNNYFLDGVHPNSFFGEIIGSIIAKYL